MTNSAGRNVIAVIGIDRYKTWQQLGNAVNDACGTAALFEQFGFERLTEPLFDDRATGKAMNGLVMDDLTVLGPNDSLVLFYAGHGGTRTHRLEPEVVKKGYLIPVDATEKTATWIELNGWLSAVSLLRARHILVILDACHSGIALSPIIKWRDAETWRDTPLSTLQSRRSRRIITSALDDQVALDSGPLLGHSLFTGCLIEGLTHGLGRKGSRSATGSELGLYLQQRVGSYPNIRQTPDFGTFDFDDRGEIAIPFLDADVGEPLHTEFGQPGRGTALGSLATARVAPDPGAHHRANKSKHDRTLYTWLHLADLQFGDDDAAQRAHKHAVLDGLRRDLQQLRRDHDLQPRAIFLTGDIAYTGGGPSRPADTAHREYETAIAWLHSISRDLGIAPEAIHVVPGNHDVDRRLDALPEVRDLISRLRAGAHSLDAALSNATEGIVIERRLAKYFEFEHRMSGSRSDPIGGRGYWRRTIQLPGCIRLRLVGLNTAFLASGDDDHGKLALGMLQIAETLTGIEDNELVVVLSHHPVIGGWLTDEPMIEPFIFSRSHIHLSGHPHPTMTDLVRRGATDGHLRISAGVARAERGVAGLPTVARYSLASIVAKSTGQTVLRVWPRRWWDREAVFAPEVEATGPAQPLIEYALTVGRDRTSGPRQARFKLAVSHGEPRGAEVVLFPGAYALGRYPGAAIVFPHDGRTSRQHASILVTPSVVMLQDESQHGTWVDGERLTKLQPVVLNDHATVQIGGSLLRLEQLSDDSTTRPAPT